MQNKTFQEFDWIEHQNTERRHLIINKKIQEKYPNSKVYSHDDYALDLYKKMAEIQVINKDYKDGDFFKITNVRRVKDLKLSFDLENGFSVVVDMDKEKKYCGIYNCLPHEFVEWVTTPEGKQEYIDSQPLIVLRGKNSNTKGDLMNGHILKIQTEFFQQIKNPTTAYAAKVIDQNRGGFIVDVCGVKGFLPGSLAAANKIIDFDSYLGKTIMVMVEDYLPEIKMFIFSNKKYISHILPHKINELSLEKEYQGSITGTTSFGIFIEWDEIFTGLLHTTKMSTETRDMFNQGKFKPGDKISFWIKEISNDNRIILTQENPLDKLNKFEEFKSKKLDVLHNGKVIKNIGSGVLVELEKDLVGLISKQELKTKKKTFKPGDNVIVSVNDVKKDKIYLSIIDET